MNSCFGAGSREFWPCNASCNPGLLTKAVLSPHSSVESRLAYRACIEAVAGSMSSNLVGCCLDFKYCHFTIFRADSDPARFKS